MHSNSHINTLTSIAASAHRLPPLLPKLIPKEEERMIVNAQYKAKQFNLSGLNGISDRTWKCISSSTKDTSKRQTGSRRKSLSS